MLRRDGTLVCYRIEKFVDGDWKSGWHTDWLGEASKKYSTKDSYMPSGRCWQQTGINGLFDAKKAFLLCEDACERFDASFRVVRLQITQKSEPITMHSGGGFYPCK